MTHLRIVVRPVDLCWEVRVPGRPVRAVDRLYSRARAIEHARELAAAERAAEIVVERRDGIVEMTLAA